MTGDPSNFDPQKLWQSQPKEYDAMTFAEIHQKAKAFEAKVRRRNLREYVASLLVIAMFVPLLFHRESWMMQAGGVLIMVALVFAVWQLHRRGSAKRVPEAGQALVAFHREELTRQRDALRSIGLWYIAPFVPGLVLILMGRWFQSPVPHRPLGLDHRIIFLTGVIVALIFVVVWLLNQRAADRLQRRIEEL